MLKRYKDDLQCESEKSLLPSEIQDHKPRKKLRILRDCRAALKIPIVGSKKADESEGFSATEVEFHTKSYLVCMF